jgi:hypothetical protein
MITTERIKKPSIMIFVLLFIISLIFLMKNINAQTSFTFAAAGDFSNVQSGNSGSVLNSLNTSDANFFLELGDADQDFSLSEQSWCNSFKAKFNNIEIIAGNHNVGENSGANISQLVRYCPDALNAVISPYAIDLGTGKYGTEYYFDYPSSDPIARFIMASPGLLGYLNYDFSIGSAHYNWLSNTIDSARAAGLKWVIVAVHKPCITMGIKTCEMGPNVMNLLLAKKVDLVLSGHDHSYQRSKELSCATAGSYNSNCVVNASSPYTKDAGTVFVIQATGGMGLYNINTTDSESGYFVEWMGANINPSWGYSKFTVTNDRIDMTWVNAVGTFSDAFSIIKKYNCSDGTAYGFGEDWTRDSDPKNTQYILDDWTSLLNKAQRWKFNTVRLAFRFSDLNRTGDTAIFDLNYTTMDTLLKLFNSRGIKVIADLHNFKDMFGEAGGQKWMNDWLQFTQYYKDDNRIAAFEIFNEPYWDTWARTEGITNRAALARAFANLTDKIRQIDPDRMIIWSDSHYFQDTAFISLLPSDAVRSNITYAFHSWNKTSDMTLALINSNETEARMSWWKKQYPDATMWLGEFGTENSAGTKGSAGWEAQNAYVIDLINWTVKNNIGFNMWLYHNSAYTGDNTRYDDLLNSSAYSEHTQDFSCGSLVGYWKFDETSGSTAYDSSGNGNNGNVNGSTWTTGRVGNALSFDGSNDYVEVQNSPSLNSTQEITVMTWINASSQQTYAWPRIACKMFWLNSGWCFLVKNDSRVLRWEIYTPNQRVVNGTTNILDNQWHHVAGTYDKNNLTIYVDGIFEANLTENADMINNNINLTIGSSGSQWFKGSIDEVKIYNRALSAEEIRNEYQFGSTTTTTTIPPDTEKPRWSNFYRVPLEPKIITTLDSVTINVTWYDNQSLNTVMIWENSTGWKGHVVYP